MERILAIVCLAIFSVQGEVTKEFVDGNLAFSTNIYREVIKNTEGNLFISPHSLQSALALVLEGAVGDTKNELQVGTHLPTASNNGAVTPILEGNQHYNLTSANKIYVNQNFEIEPDYKTKVVQAYKSEVENIDFGQSVIAAGTINKWVEKKTNNKIKDFINAGLLQSNPQIVLINTLHFQAKWERTFNAYNTIKLPFHTAVNRAVQIDTMKITNLFKYHECSRLKAKFLELPYKSGDDEVSLIVALPNEIEGLADLEKSIDKVFTISNFTEEQVRVQLPRFRVESSITFNEVLQNLGIAKLFSSEANLGGISKKSALSVSTVLQKTFVEVNEEGTEAAAATAIISFGSSGPNPNLKEFVANHPFLFYIKANGVVLFTGRFVNPEE